MQRIRKVLDNQLDKMGKYITIIIGKSAELKEVFCDYCGGISGIRRGCFRG